MDRQYKVHQNVNVHSARTSWETMDPEIHAENRHAQFEGAERELCPLGRFGATSAGEHKLLAQGVSLNSQRSSP